MLFLGRRSLQLVQILCVPNLGEGDGRVAAHEGDGIVQPPHQEGPSPLVADVPKRDHGVPTHHAILVVAQASQGFDCSWKPQASQADCCEGSDDGVVTNLVRVAREPFQEGEGFLRVQGGCCQRNTQSGVRVGIVGQLFEGFNSRRMAQLSQGSRKPPPDERFGVAREPG